MHACIKETHKQTILILIAIHIETDSFAVFIIHYVFIVYCGALPNGYGACDPLFEFNTLTGGEFHDLSGWNCHGLFGSRINTLTCGTTTYREISEAFQYGRFALCEAFFDSTKNGINGL